MHTMAFCLVTLRPAAIGKVKGLKKQDKNKDKQHLVVRWHVDATLKSVHSVISIALPRGN